MVKPEVMSELLAHHQAAPGRRVVCCGVEVCIVYFCDCLGDVISLHPDLGKTEPTISTISVVAGSDFAGNGFALPALARCDGARFGSQVEHTRDGPIIFCLGQVGVPDSSYAVDDTKC